MRLERDETMQDLSLSAFHAAALAFKSTRVAKIIESHERRAFIFWMKDDGGQCPATHNGVAGGISP